MNPTLRDTPTWTAALVIEGLTAFYRAILGQTDDALHVTPRSVQVRGHFGEFDVESERPQASGRS
jgi:hypothetical protein